MEGSHSLSSNSYWRRSNGYARNWSMPSKSSGFHLRRSSNHTVRRQILTLSSPDAMSTSSTLKMRSWVETLVLC
eukprot:6934432-Prymnesium_polylepis.1